jgi:membrane-associated phospholipid phosphatase
MEVPAYSQAGAPDLVARMRACLPAKIGVWVGLAIGICVPYFGLQHVGGPAPRALAETFVDRAIPFSPAWIYVYVSLGVLVPLAPLLAATRAELTRYAVGLTLLCVPCFLIFLAVPVLGPRPTATAGPDLYTLIVLVDRPSNSLPSLHAGLTLYSLLFTHRILGRTLSPSGRRAMATFGAAWGALILYSTLATKQHWAVDLPAGMLIAWAAHRLAWRSDARQPDRAWR